MLSLQWGLDFRGSGGRSWEQKSNKINQNSRSKMGCLLASIFFGFWWILEAKLAPSWVGKSTQNRFKKALKNRWQKSAVLEPSWVPKGAQHGPPPLPPTPAWGPAWVRRGVRRRGPGPPPLPPVEVNSEGPKDPRTPSKRALAGPEGPRPDLSPSGCGPRPFSRMSNTATIQILTTNN